MLYEPISLLRATTIWAHKRHGFRVRDGQQRKNAFRIRDLLDFTIDASSIHVAGGKKNIKGTGTGETYYTIIGSSILKSRENQRDHI